MIIGNFVFGFTSVYNFSLTAIISYEMLEFFLFDKVGTLCRRLWAGIVIC